MQYSGVESSDLDSTVELFANFFESVYSVSRFNKSSFTQLNSSINIGSIQFSFEEVNTALLSLKSNSSSGPDGIPATVLKECCSSICTPLHMIFNKSLQDGIFIEEWKLSYLVPIHKSGSKSNIQKYRGICKLSAIPKLFEGILKNKLDFLTSEYLSEVQHGFVSGRSTITNLAYFTSFVTNAMESGFQVDAVYTDFSKAFDSVNHQILLAKLEIFGFHSQLLLWISSYLSCRKQQVKIENSFSREIQCTSGVPQGSHLGPLFFIIFINDIISAFKYCRCLLYADDLKLFLTINSLCDCQLIQSDLDSLSHWCHVNCLELNIKKCNIISFTRKYTSIRFNYTIESNVLDRVSNIKDLGVILDSSLNFKNHINFLVPKANSLVGFIKRNCKDFRDPYVLLSLYTSLVRSLLEYADVIWSPAFKVNSDRVESVQRRFTKYVFNKMNWGFCPDYKARCLLLGIKSLESRRKIHGVMLIRDLLCYHIKCPTLLALLPIHVPARSTRTRVFLFQKNIEQFMDAMKRYEDVKLISMKCF